MFYVNKKVACPHLLHCPLLSSLLSLSVHLFLFFILSICFSLNLQADTVNNDLCGNAEPITLNYSSSGSLGSSDKNDYFQFILSSPGTLTITVTNAMQDLDAFLYNSTCSTLLVSDEAISNNPSITYTYTGTSSTTLKLRLLYYPNWNSTNYNISVTFTPITTTIVNIGLRDFALRNPLATRNIKGNISVIGNTVLCVKNSSGNCYDYTETLANSQLDLKYIDINTTDSRTYNNSSQAKLAIPSTATIKWAGLYTQGYLNGTNSTDIGISIKEAVYVTIPSIGTLEVVPNVIDIYANYDLLSPYILDGYTYDTYASVPSLIGKTGSSVNGWITGANIKANTGTEDSGLGNFGAWTLVVIYEETSETLKNISVYDGYKRIANDTGFTTVDIPISGFVTPLNGIVNSTVSLFVGEGDRGITGDQLYVSNLSGTFVPINATNAFSSIVTGFEANPSFVNNQGIDVQNHQIGIDSNTSHPQIIGNNQKNTTVRMTSSKDAYFPSMVAFITELYVPDMCYEENITQNGAVPTEIFVGDILDFEVLISNKSYEPAQRVSISRDFNDESEYVRNSTAVKSASVFQMKTDIAADDVVTYLESSNVLTLNLGTGATTLIGGTFVKDQNETFKFSFEVQADGNLTNAYKVSYKDDSNITGGSVVYAGSPIGKCSDRNITSTVVPILPSGKVRIVESGKNWNDNNGRLFTKIVNKATQYDILFATNDTGASLTTGKIKKLEILNIENQASPVVVSTPITALTTITQRYLISIIHMKAYKRLQFRITLEDGSTALSNDFSVRPADFNGTIDNLWAGETLTAVPGNIKARDNVSNTALGYNKTLTASNISSVNIDPLKTCTANTTSSLVDSLSMLFIDGQSSSVTALFKDIVTNLAVTIKDSDWVASSDDVINTDCIVGSSSNIANISGLFGCNIEGNISVTVQPYELNVTDANFTTSTGQSWLYDGNVSDMFVTAKAKVQANNKQHVGLQNFTDVCYAQPVDLAFHYDVNNTNNGVNLSYSTTSGTMASVDKNISDINKTITLPTTLFTTSSAIAEYKFNIDRVYKTPLNPIDIALKDVNVTTTSVAKDENNKIVAKGTKFYYGRVKTKDIMTDKADVNHTLHVEVYSEKPLTGFYQNTLRWYINKDDNGTTVLSDGNFSENIGFINNQNSSKIKVTDTGSFNKGVLNFNIKNTPPQEKSSTIHVDIPSWLWNNNFKDYNFTNGSDCTTHPCFDYKYIKDTNASGISSGSFNGSTIGKDYNATYQKTGVKTFR